MILQSSPIKTSIHIGDFQVLSLMTTEGNYILLPGGGANTTENIFVNWQHHSIWMEKPDSKPATR